MGFPFYASVVQNERITSEDHFQDTRHISLDISNSDMKFAPGDVLCINPLTPWNAIDDFLTCLNIHKLSRVRIKSVSNQNVFEEFYVRSLVQGESFSNSLAQSFLAGSVFRCDGCCKCISTQVLF